MPAVNNGVGVLFPNNEIKISLPTFKFLSSIKISNFCHKNLIPPQVITSLDLQGVEPVDKHMSKSLLQSVQLAIEIATKSVERAAEHEASRRDQEARGSLERQRLQNEKVVEVERSKLLQLQAESACVESTGEARLFRSARRLYVIPLMCY